MERPTYAYIGRDKGGCVLVVITDYGDKDTGQAVKKAIVRGLTVERIDWDTYRNKVSLEPNFLNCTCPVLQPGLFGEAK